ncbi:MAG: hypothetical protein QOF14_5928 [Hyphomicrobiales bacterium]|jgi:hypothetical protein|nr:hypothetical protein [Hyphomicrobiales bacterium]
MKNTAAIEALERRLADFERKGNALIEVINDLREEDGLPPRGPFGGGSDSSGAKGATLTSIKPDTFYGKKLQTAVREYLEMRFAAARGTDPATPRQIYDAITTGGYTFDVKEEATALVSLRQLLRKRTAFFHKLPNGTYGLTAWYPDAKKPKPESDDEEIIIVPDEMKAATTKKAAAAS